ncbi:unnamed protein product [Rhizoctonia solani]|uniref:Laminin domain protein n=2 Tax=Rhizoctonia solani TaxID=456999 RepID=A0A8H3CTE5_9AGAM
MSNYPPDQVLSPPDLPLYLESVCKLEPILGVPSDDQVIGIHTVIRVANKVVDVQSVGNPALLNRISEHLFNAQMGKYSKYRSKYPCSIFPMNVTYTPPKLPVHVSVNLEPISGPPSEEQVTNVQNAIRLYQKLTDVPSLFDPQVNAELSQHLFDIQMASYIHRCGQAVPSPRETTPLDPPTNTHSTEQASKETNTSANNAGRGSDTVEPYQSSQLPLDLNLQDAIERSNQIAERANQLAERSNQLIERSNLISDQLSQAIERSSPPADQPTNLAEKLTELLGRISERFDQSSHPIEAVMKSIEKLGDTLKNINKVLVGIQHAIIRSHKGNTVNAVNCLVNEKGDTFMRGGFTFSGLSDIFASQSDTLLPVTVDGVSQYFYISDIWLKHFLHFYNIDGGFWENAQKTGLKEGCEAAARHTLGLYLSSYLGQICYPPELPPFLRNVYDLKPIIGVPSDDETIGIHAVVQAARKASEIPGMHDSGLIMKLTEHLFSAQMARYRNKYSLITFPSDAVYTPPTLPTHISVNLEPISGAPTDSEIIKVQEAFQTYQELRRFPSMFDTQVNMELSQHLFDIQMARYMRVAGESPPNPVPQEIARPEHPAQTPEAYALTEEAIGITNNIGTGANATTVCQGPQSTRGIDVHELMERSNQLAERFNQLLERSNDIAEQRNQTTDQSGSHTFTEQLGHVLERLTQLLEQSHQPVVQSDQLGERFNQLFERFNHLAEQSQQPAQRANELAVQSNELAARANQLSEQANKCGERAGDVLHNINRVLVGIQHATVRNHQGNTFKAADCLVNEKGNTLGQSRATQYATFESFLDELAEQPNCQLPITIEGLSHILRIEDKWLGRFLRFFDIGDQFIESRNSAKLKDGDAASARIVLSRYLSSCLG